MENNDLTDLSIDISGYEVDTEYSGEDISGTLMLQMVSPLQIYVTLNTREYFSHILVEHEKVTPWIIKATVENPIRICTDSSKSDEQRYQYFGFIHHENKIKLAKTVTVKREDESEAVITCFFTGNLNQLNTEGIIYDDGTVKKE